MPDPGSPASELCLAPGPFTASLQATQERSPPKWLCYAYHAVAHGRHRVKASSHFQVQYGSFPQQECGPQALAFLYFSEMHQFGLQGAFASGSVQHKLPDSTAVTLSYLRTHRVATTIGSAVLAESECAWGKSIFAKVSRAPLRSANPHKAEDTLNRRFCPDCETFTRNAS